MVGAHDAVQHAAVRPQFAVAAAGELRRRLDDADGLAGRALGGAEQAEQTRLQGAQGLVVVLLRQSALGTPAALAGTVALVRCAAVRADADCAGHGSIVPGSVRLYTNAWFLDAVWTSETRIWTSEAGTWMARGQPQDARIRTPGSRRRVPGAACRIPDALQTADSVSLYTSMTDSSAGQW